MDKEEREKKGQEYFNEQAVIWDKREVGLNDFFFFFVSFFFLLFFFFCLFVCLFVCFNFFFLLGFERNCEMGGEIHKGEG